MRHWLRFLLEKQADRRDRILEIQSHHNKRDVSLIIRDKNVRATRRASVAVNKCEPSLRQMPQLN
jgi:hypothetical protein